MRGPNLALRFTLELTVLAALAYWGFWVGDTLVMNIVLGLGAPLLGATVWGLFIAPKAKRRLPTPCGSRSRSTYSPSRSGGRVLRVDPVGHRLRRRGGGEPDAHVRIGPAGITRAWEER